MACICPNEECTQGIVGEVVICTCTATVFVDCTDGVPTPVGEEYICRTTIETIPCEDGTIIETEDGFVCRQTLQTEPIRTDVITPIALTPEYFKDVSWTVAFKEDGSWAGYFSFLPNYAAASQNSFRIGYNYGISEDTLWEHTFSPDSFQVFEGTLQPFIVEQIIPDEQASKFLEVISLNIESKRYQSHFDYSENNKIGFNKAVIYNNTENSGMLNLFPQKTLTDIKNYPKTNGDSQDILFTTINGKHNFNYFYNRVRKEINNIPIWLNDENMLNKALNPQAISFKGKNPLERLRGQYFFTRLINDKESRYQILLKNTINTENIY